MTEEKTPATDTPNTFYLFSFMFTIGGIVESSEDAQTARDRLNQELSLFYGPDTVTVTEFREATPSEVSEYQTAVAQAVTETADETTVN